MARSVDRDGRTALMAAVIGQDQSLANLLIGNGADLDAVDHAGFSALHFAAQNCDVETASALLAAGAAVDLRDSYGNTPLWRAVFHSRGRGELIELLLKAGASPNVENDSGVSPFKLAQTIANYDVLRFFV